jgi:hypothetical protein
VGDFLKGTTMDRADRKSILHRAAGIEGLELAAELASAAAALFVGANW